MAVETLIEVTKYRVVGQNARANSTQHIGSISKVSETIGKKVNGIHTQLYDVIDLYGRKILTTDAAGRDLIKGKINTTDINKYVVTGRRARYQGKDTVKIPAEADVIKVVERAAVINNVPSKVFDVISANGSRIITTDQEGFDALNIP